ncbi:hypothetical protein D3C77_600690 [compost metagenome]
MGDHPVGAGVGGATRGRIVIEHGVDQGALAAVGIGHHIAVSAGGGVEEGHDLQLRGCVAIHADTPRGIQGGKILDFSAYAYSLGVACGREEARRAGHGARRGVS